MTLRCLVFVPLASLLALGACVPDGPPTGKQKPPPPASRPAVVARPATPAASAANSAPSAPPSPELVAPFSDNFERAQPGPDWNLTGPGWAVHEGRLCGTNVRNHPAWLSRRLPLNARIEFDATSGSPEGDLKAEAWGDGASSATSVSYTNATSYVIIFGGWKNTFHVLARLDEHAPDRPQVRVATGESDPRAQAVLPDRLYHFKIERSDGKTVRYLVDDVEILALVDPSPLAGPGHDHFGFNDWQVPVCFDNLTITPLKS